MIFRKKIPTGEQMARDDSKLHELRVQVETLIQKQREIERELEHQKITNEIVLLTVKDRLDYELLHNPGQDWMSGHPQKSAELLDKGYMIRKTFKHGEWELWMKPELKQST